MPQTTAPKISTSSKSKAPLFIALAVALVLGAGIVIWLWSQNTSRNSTSSNTPSSSEITDQTKVTVENKRATTKNTITTIEGEVKNNDSSSHSGILTATFYNASGEQIGVGTGTFKNVGAGQTASFKFYTMSAVEGYADLKVVVTKLN